MSTSDGANVTCLGLPHPSKRKAVSSLDKPKASKKKGAVRTVTSAHMQAPPPKVVMALDEDDEDDGIVLDMSAPTSASRGEPCIPPDVEAPQEPSQPNTTKRPSRKLRIPCAENLAVLERASAPQWCTQAQVQSLCFEKVKAPKGLEAVFEAQHVCAYTPEADTPVDFQRAYEASLNMNAVRFETRYHANRENSILLSNIALAHIGREELNAAAAFKRTMGVTGPPPPRKLLLWLLVADPEQMGPKTLRSWIDGFAYIAAPALEARDARASLAVGRAHVHEALAAHGAGDALATRQQPAIGLMLVDNVCRRNVLWLDAENGGVSEDDTGDLDIMRSCLSSLRSALLGVWAPPDVDALPGSLYMEAVLTDDAVAESEGALLRGVARAASLFASYVRPETTPFGEIQAQGLVPLDLWVKLTPRSHVSDSAMELMHRERFLCDLDECGPSKQNPIDTEDHLRRAGYHFHDVAYPGMLLVQPEAYHESRRAVLTMGEESWHLASDKLHSEGRRLIERMMVLSARPCLRDVRRHLSLYAGLQQPGSPIVAAKLVSLRHELRPVAQLDSLYVQPCHLNTFVPMYPAQTLRDHASGILRDMVELSARVSLSDDDPRVVRMTGIHAPPDKRGSAVASSSSTTLCQMEGIEFEIDEHGSSMQDWFTANDSSHLPRPPPPPVDSSESVHLPIRRLHEVADHSLPHLTIGQTIAHTVSLTPLGNGGTSGSVLAATVLPVLEAARRAYGDGISLAEAMRRLSECANRAQD